MPPFACLDLARRGQRSMRRAGHQGPSGSSPISRWHLSQQPRTSDTSTELLRLTLSPRSQQVMGSSYLFLKEGLEQSISRLIETGRNRLAVAASEHQRADRSISARRRRDWRPAAGRRARRKTVIAPEGPFSTNLAPEGPSRGQAAVVSRAWPTARLADRPTLAGGRGTARPGGRGGGAICSRGGAFVCNIVYQTAAAIFPGALKTPCWVQKALNEARIASALATARLPASISWRVCSSTPVYTGVGPAAVRSFPSLT